MVRSDYGKDISPELQTQLTKRARQQKLGDKIVRIYAVRVKLAS